jgi:superfamily I DNA/RNA helicase
MKESIGAEIDYAASCLIKWHHAGEPLNDMAVICASGLHSRLMEQRLRREGLDHLWMGSRDRKISFDPARPRISILSAQSSKGLEFKSVIFVGLGHLSAAEESHIL